MKNVCAGNVGQIDFADTGQCPIIIAQSPSGKAQLYYPKSLPRSHGVSMPSFMPIRQKLWSVEGFLYIGFILD